jgi:hypothetical protein
MTNVKIAKASELMKRETEARDSSVYMSAEWVLLLGAAQGTEEIMVELGCEKWNGYEFVEGGT